MKASNEIRVFRETIINDYEVYIEMLNYVESFFLKYIKVIKNSNFMSLK